jgi:hypothetical protein
VKLNEENERKYGQITLNQKSYPQGNVQRCLSNPQEKRAQAQEKKLKSQIQKGKNKGNKTKKMAAKK